MDLYHAIHMAIEAHDKQRRKIDNAIYATHPLEVGMLLAKNGFDDSVIIAGILHDTLEDTSTTFSEIEQVFGNRVAQYVFMCSESNKSLSWKERKVNYLEAMKESPLEVLYIICADKISNIKSIYRNLNEAIWDQFNAGYDQQKWYYESVLQALEPIKDHPMYHELSTYINAVFHAS